MHKEKKTQTAKGTAKRELTQEKKKPSVTQQEESQDVELPEVDLKKFLGCGG